MAQSHFGHCTSVIVIFSQSHASACVKNFQFHTDVYVIIPFSLLLISRALLNDLHESSLFFGLMVTTGIGCPIFQALSMTDIGISNSCVVFGIFTGYSIICPSHSVAIVCHDTISVIFHCPQPLSVADISNVNLLHSSACIDLVLPTLYVISGAVVSILFISTFLYAIFHIESTALKHIYFQL
ncbi:hypothetical protein J5751_02095 [bacterium]|nr:hypothetical protein [bacterium]